MGQRPFQRFLDEHREAVHRFLVAAAGRDDADDCFQETFIAAMRAYPRLPADANERAWVLTIASRKAIDAHRGGRRRPEPSPDAGERAAAPEPERPDPDLWRLVAELPAKQRGAVALRYVGGLSHAEIGDALNCSEQAARRNLHEALRKLRERWTP